MKTKETTYLSSLYVEWCATVEKRRGLMVPVSSLADEGKRRHDPGFRSVYMFEKSAAEEIKAAGSSKGFRRFVPYSDRLIIDLDSGESQLNGITALLSGYSYKLYRSGSKGFHFEIETPLYYGHDLPQAHKEFVAGLNVGADLSLYRHSSLVALPGRIHPKTQKRKTEIAANVGELLTIPEPTQVWLPTPQIEESEFDLAFLFTRLATTAAQEPDQGWRHTTLWSVAESMSRLGLHIDTAIDLLTRINEQWKNPKAADEVERAVKQAYQRTGS